MMTFNPEDQTYLQIEAVQRNIDQMVQLSVQLMSRDRFRFAVRDGKIFALPIERDDLTQSILDYIKTQIATAHLEIHRLRQGVNRC